MSTDLKKLVEKWFKETHKAGEVTSDLYETLLAMAAEIEANREEIERLKNPVKSCFAAPQDEECEDQPKTQKGVKG